MKIKTPEGTSSGPTTDDITTQPRQPEQMIIQDVLIDDNTIRTY